MQQWTTSGIQTNQQFEFWREKVCQSFVPLRPERTTGKAKRRFRGELSVWQSAGIHFARVSGDGQSVYRDAQSISNKDNAVFFLNYQCRGNSVVDQGGRTSTLRPGSFTLLDAMQPFRMDVSDDFDQLSIKIPHSFLKPLLTSHTKVLATAIHGETTSARLAMKALIAIADEGELATSNFSRLAIEHALQLTTMALMPDQVQAANNEKTKKTLHSLWQRATHLMQLEVDNADFSPVKVAQDLGISLRYLQAAFTQSNTSIRQWVLDQRLSRCRDDLRWPTHFSNSIAGIAYSHGFNDLSYFNRAFKARYGCAPSQYKARAQP
jgi:AraC family transcriptional regulator, positive regulator of tynA and feaB